MQGGNLIQAASFAAYPFVDSMLTVGIALGVSTVGRTMFWGSIGPLITQITQPGEREQWFGFVQAMRNAGYGVGGLLAGLALSIGTDAAYEAVVIANAASFVVAFLLMTGVTAGGRPEIAPAARPAGRGLVLRDRGYRWLVLAIFGYALTEMTLNVAMPVYFADLLGLPAWVPGAVFVINTVMIGLGQGLVVRSMTGAIRVRVRAARHRLHRLLLRDDVRRGRAVGGPRHRRGARRRGVYTIGELMAGPVLGALSAEAAPDEHRGRYMSVVQLAWNISGAVAPLLYAALLDRGSLAIWGGAIVLCGLWAAVSLRMATLLPRARQPVTNAVEASVEEPAEAAPPA